MGEVSWYVNMLGIVVSIIGTLMMFKGAPRDSLSFEGETMGSPFKKENIAEINALKRRAVLSRRGLRLLVCGFIFQAIGQIMVFPW